MATVDASISEAASASDESATLHALAPIADTDAGDYTSSAGGSLYAAIDEVVASATDFIKSGDEPHSDAVKFQHAAASSNSAPRVIGYEAKATGGGQVNVTVELWCADTLIATFTDTNVASLSKYYHQLTQAQRAAITDKSQLYTKVIASRVGNIINASITEYATAIDSLSVATAGPVWSAIPDLNFIQGTALDSPSLAQYADSPDPITFDLASGSLPSAITFDPDTVVFSYDGTSLGATIGDPYEVTGVTIGADDAQTPASAEFVDRITPTAVKRWHKFNTGTGGNDLDKYPIAGQPATGWVGTWYSGITDSYYSGSVSPPLNEPYIDSSVKPSGNASLRHQILSQYGVSSPSGSPVDFIWYFGGNGNRAFGFGAGEVFYFQWRQRFDQNYIDTVLTANGGTQQYGQKQIYVTAGLDPDTGDEIGAHDPNSMQVVVLTFYQFKFPQLMCDWTGYGSGNVGGSSWFVALSDVGPQDIPQNARPDTRDITSLVGATCTRDIAFNECTQPNGPAGCFSFVADEWMTFQVMVDLRDCDPDTQPEPFDYPPGHEFAGYPTGRYRWQGSKVKLWGAREGGAQELLVDWNPAVPGYFPLDAGEKPNLKFQKIRLSQHVTDKNPEQQHPTESTWYDELIVSTEFIADPA